MGRDRGDAGESLAEACVDTLTLPTAEWQGRAGLADLARALGGDMAATQLAASREEIKRRLELAASDGGA